MSHAEIFLMAQQRPKDQVQSPEEQPGSSSWSLKISSALWLRAGSPPTGGPQGNASAISLPQHHEDQGPEVRLVLRATLGDAGTLQNNCRPFVSAPEAAVTHRRWIPNTTHQAAQPVLGSRTGTKSSSCWDSGFIITAQVAPCPQDLQSHLGSRT